MHIYIYIRLILGYNEYFSLFLFYFSIFLFLVYNALEHSLASYSKLVKL